jgi:hypothetical protein
MEKTKKEFDFVVKTVDGKRLVFYKDELVKDVVETIEHQGVISASNGVCTLTFKVIAKCE